MVVGALITVVFGSIEPEPWSIQYKEPISINNDNYVVNQNFNYN